MPLLQCLVPIGVGALLLLVLGLTAPLWMRLVNKLAQLWKNQMNEAESSLEDSGKSEKSESDK